MPIKVAAAPKNAMKLLQTGIEEYLTSGLTTARLGRVEGLATPYRVFCLGLDALVGNKPIAKSAQQVGWRAHLVDSKKKPVAAAELVITRRGLRFAEISFGPHAVDDSASRTAAERWSDRTKRPYELTLLRIPGAYCAAYWLRSDDETPDAFVPIAPCPPSLLPNKVYREKELREALLPEARKQLDEAQEGAR